MTEVLDEDEEFRRAQGAARAPFIHQDGKPRPKPQVQARNRHIGCPLVWFQRAYAAARSKGDLAVWLWLWRLRTIRGSRTVRLANGGLADLGITRYTKYRALKRFAEAGLIDIDRKEGNATVVAFRKGPRRV
jgi:hypothetical protein